MTHVSHYHQPAQGPGHTDVAGQGEQAPGKGVGLGSGAASDATVRSLDFPLSVTGSHWRMDKPVVAAMA